MFAQVSARRLQGWRQADRLSATVASGIRCKTTARVLSLSLSLCLSPLVLCYPPPLLQCNHHPLLLIPSFPPFFAFSSQKDRLILEDQSGRVMLAGSILAHTCQLVTGVVVAVKGRINDDGDFLANDEVFSFDVANVEDEHAASSALPILSLPSHKLPRRLVLFVSGLGLGTASSPVHDLAVQLLVDFVCGRMADPKSADLASRIVRVVLAGDSVQAVDLHDLRERFGNNKLKASLSTPSKQLDVFLAQLLTSCFVDIMPGRSDPANAALPQQVTVRISFFLSSSSSTSRSLIV